MGGKGRRRREKNYLAAHGGHSRLPPPPNPSQVDAVPFKLRKILSFTNESLNHVDNDDGSAKPSKFSEKKKKQRGSDAEKKFSLEDTIISEGNVEDGDVGDRMASLQTDDDDDDKGMATVRDEKRKKKRKRKQVSDLRFEALMEKSNGSEKKRERKKKYLEAKKKKRKASKSEENLDFPLREQIKFGDVVQAPPKLLARPKVLKNIPDASQERIRLKAVEAYRKHKGWTSRPGLQLPSVTATPTL